MEPKNFKVHNHTIKLGRLRGDPSKPCLCFTDYLNLATLGDPPISADWMATVADWPMFLNDRFGDCVIAAFGHAIHVWTTNADVRAVTVADGDIQREYFRQTGGSDNGLVIADALDELTRVSLGGQKIRCYAKIVRQTKADWIEACKHAIHLFGFCNFGVSLPNSFQNEINAGVPWRNTRDRPNPGLGHSMLAASYDQDGVTFATWGQEQKATWDWVWKYADEAFVAVSPCWIDNSTPPMGLDLRLMHDNFVALTGNDPGNFPPVDPPPPPPPVDGRLGTLTIPATLPIGTYALVAHETFAGDQAYNALVLQQQAAQFNFDPAKIAALLQLLMQLLQLFGNQPTPPNKAA